jgi:hypothetical protein
MKITRKEKIIARELGVTPAGLDYLCRFVAKERHPSRRGSEAEPLVRLCHLASPPGQEITATGREPVARARKMGW